MHAHTHTQGRRGLSHCKAFCIATPFLHHCSTARCMSQLNRLLEHWVPSPSLPLWLLAASNFDDRGGRHARGPGRQQGVGYAQRCRNTARDSGIPKCRSTVLSLGIILGWQKQSGNKSIVGICSVVLAVCFRSRSFCITRPFHKSSAHLMLL
jgi:hypothetical protein